jgi:2-aminoadipate transaminase
MDWNRQFAERTAQMWRSAVRELLKLTLQPGMISFAGGLPAAELFPIERVRQAGEAVLRCHGQRALQYGETEGLADLRDWIAARFSTPQVRLDRDNVAIVSGGQQALDLLGRVMLNPGDRVVVENPTYLALLSAWRPLGVEFLPVKSDADGICVEQLEGLLNRQPKLLYTIPNFQNPQGTTLSLERRLELIRLLTDHDVAVVEDNPYGDLRYSGERLPDLFTLDLGLGSMPGAQGRVLHVGTFSKVLMPGLRVGWVVAPAAVIDKLVQAKQAADLHTSTFNQHVTWELIREGFLEQHIPFLQEHYRTRRDAMLAALDRHLPAQTTWTRPDGGMFLMLKLPPGLDGGELLTHALEQNIAFVPGAEFHLDGAGRDTIRLNFTNVGPEQIEEGIQRLGKLLRQRCVVTERPWFASR